MRVSGHTQHSKLRTCCRIWSGNIRPSTIQSRFGTKQFSTVRSLFHLWWRYQTCYHHMANATGTYVVCVWKGQTYHMLWQVPQISKGGLRKKFTTGFFIVFPLVKSCLLFSVL
jgi:hypothetical protein